MDAISYSYADKAHKRLKKFIENPDSTSGVLTVPKTIAAGETITIPAGRVAILPDLQVDGDLVVDGDLFIPTGSMTSQVVQKVTSTDNAVVKFDGVTGQVQNSSVIIDDNGNVGIGTSSNLLSNVDSSRTVLTIKGKGTTASGGVGIVQLTSNASGNLSPVLGNYEWHISDNTNSTSTRGAFISVSASGSTVGNMGTYMTFATKQDGVSNAGKEVMLISASGDILAISGTGGLGYGAGAGGTVTQWTSKSTAVTLNKPTGRIILNNSALAAGATNYFLFNNSNITINDTIKVTTVGATYVIVGSYSVEAEAVGAGFCYIVIKNNTAGSLSEAVQLNFTVIKGANA